MVTAAVKFSRPRTGYAIFVYENRYCPAVVSVNIIKNISFTDFPSDAINEYTRQKHGPRLPHDVIVIGIFFIGTRLTVTVRPDYRNGINHRDYHVSINTHHHHRGIACGIHAELQ